MLAGRKILIVLSELRQMLMANVQEASTLAHRPRAFDALTHRQLFVDRNHGPAKAPLELLKELFYTAAHCTALFSILLRNRSEL